MFKLCQILVSTGWLQIALASSGAVLLVGCGQKGPLFLPTSEAAAGRATLPQILTPASPAAAPPATGTATPAPRP